MPRVILAVAASFTSSATGILVRPAFMVLRKMFGSPTYKRTTKATSPGIRPTRNMPRHPMMGSNAGVTSAATNTPACQPSAT
jgi:hypothetical protein